MRSRWLALGALGLCAWALAATPAAAKEERLFGGHLGTFTEARGLWADQKSHDVYAIGGRNERQQVTIAATAGKFKLEFEGETTGDLAFDIKRGPLEVALSNMICGGGNCLFVNGGPGNASGSNPYLITFQGALATTDVEELKCVAGSEPLSGGAGCTATTSVNGVNGSVSRYHANGTPSEFTALGSNAIDGLGGADLTAQKGLHFSPNPAEAQVAVDESSGTTAGEIYVTATEDHKVEIFGAGGEHLGELTQYEETPGNAGTLKALGRVCGVAVDGAGNVYLADTATGIHKYTPSGAVVASTDTKANFTAVSEPCALAAGRGPSAGALFAVGFNGAKLFKLDASGAVKYEISQGNTAIAVDPTSGHVLAAAGNQIEEWDAASESSASAVGSIGAGSGTTGVAVDGTTGKGGTVYLSRSGDPHLDVYGPYVKLPVVETKPASEVGGTSATLKGTISADSGPSAECEFQAILTETFKAQKKAAEEEASANGETKRPEELTEAAFAGAQSVECEGGPFTGSATNPVSGKAEGLVPEAEYVFRIVGENANGKVHGEELGFETLGKPQVQGGASSHVTTTSAQIDAEVSPRGLPSSFQVQYVTEQQFQEDEFAQAVTLIGPTVPAQVSGTGDLSAGTGTGGIASGFSQVNGLATASGAFAVGQAIEGTGIPAGTTIAALNTGAGTLTLSQPATQSAASATGKGDLTEGSQTIEGAIQLSGAFAVGQGISGQGIPAGTTITAVEEPSPNTFKLTISQAVQTGGTATEASLKAGVALTAGAKVIANLATSAGRFAPGQGIEGAGIPSGTTIVAATPNELTLSKAVTVAAAGVALSAQGFQPATLQIAGLAPDSAYRFRALAESAAGSETEAAAHPFATRALGGPGLLDGRAYELISPPQRAGEVFALDPSRVGGGSCAFCMPGWNNPKAPMQSSPEGDAVAYEGDPFFGGLAAESNSYVARRGGESWQTTALGEPQFDAQDFKAFSPDLSKAILLQSSPALSEEAPEGFADLYLREEGGALQTLISSEPPNREAGEQGKEPFKITYAGANAGSEASPAFSHVIFEANDALTPKEEGIAPDAPEVGAEEDDLYEWSGGKLHLVNVLEGNATAAPDATIGSGGLLGIGGENFDFAHAISDDGSRIFWSALPSGQLYVREGGISTTEIPDHTGKFLTASADGAKVLLSDGMLFELEDLGAPVDLSGGAGGFQGIAGASEDLSRIYFVDTEALTPPEEENENAEAASKGALNLYLWEEGAVRFIAILDPFDNASNLQQLGVWHAAPGNRLAQASADGRFLAFQATAQPTGYDNTVREAKFCENSGEKSGGSGKGASECFEIFEYDALANTLSCASCNPSGERPSGSSTLQLIFAHEEFLPQPANLPREGQGRLFFESLDALVGADTNGRVADVYEFEPAGVGDCERAKGCLALISSGHGAKDSQFLSASDSGDDVFFTTREQLLHQDRNDLMDLYDARVGGGIEEEEAAPPCAGDACRPPGSAPPPFQAPSSTQTQPEGPVGAPHCRRGYLRKGGKCVRRHKPHRRKHRKAAKHRGAHR